MNWYIVRHGEKEVGDFYNPILRYQDQPISAIGQEEAKNLVPYFKEKSISTIYISEYIRTRQTAQAVADELKLSPVVDRRLNEIEIGLMEGLSGEEIQAKFPEVWQAFQDRNRDFQFPEGESGKQVLARINSFLEEKKKDDENILLVSHDGWIRILVSHVLDIPVYRRWDFQVDTCGIMEIAYQPEYDQWKLIRFNHVRK